MDIIYDLEDDTVCGAIENTVSIFVIRAASKVSLRRPRRVYFNCLVDIDEDMILEEGLEYSKY